MGEAMFFAVITWVCALVFIGIGIFAIKKKTPMHFWSGTTVKTEEIKDVKAYNKANGIMWMGYGFIYILSGIIEIVLQNGVGAALMSFWSVGGLIIMIIAYLRIYKKYKV
jgi:hypothetical protein